jgi:hypothetical protein
MDGKTHEGIKVHEREEGNGDTRRKTCFFDYSLQLNFSRKKHFTTKILLVT